jgi:hypothetical protein
MKLLAVLPLAILLAACAAFPLVPDESSGFPLARPLTAASLLDYMASADSEDLRRNSTGQAASLAAGMAPRESLARGLALVEVDGRAAEAAGYLGAALASDQLRWRASGRELTEMLHRHALRMRELDRERAARVDLEEKLEALRQVERDMGGRSR